MPEPIFSLRRLGAGCLAALCSIAVAQAQHAPENQLKAALIYNFALFIEWPATGADKDEPFTLCALSNNLVSDALAQLQQKTIAARALHVKILADKDDVHGCKVLYLDKDDTALPQALKAKAETHSVLTISDRPSAIEDGAMIAIVEENKRLIFDINLSAARQSRLNISSKLLRLARKVW